ncbi:MAG TPA: glutathione S-transferase family protein [Candidatus Binataceae bacterium]|nr:glutathione S-transferase family protein [Candidatus Binataceae bacterium]
MLKFYGTSKSRSARSLWAAEELGIKYEHIATPVPQAKSPEHLKINPNGHIPAIDDDGTIIWESMAINLYLAEKYGKGSLWPASVQDHGHAYQWSFFGMTEIEPHLMSLLAQRIFLPADQRDEKVAQNAINALKAPLRVLDAALKGREYLLGSSFSIADLNVAAVLSFAMLVKLDLSATPTAEAWLQKCLGREANKKVRSLP